jgi:hypothetical protein
MNGDRIFLRLGENGALGADARQWVLYRLAHTDKPQPGSTWQGVQWKAVSYVRSSKRILAQCIGKKGINLSQEGQAALDALADNFDCWKADPPQKGTPVAPKALKPPETRLMGLGTGPISGDRYSIYVRLGPRCSLGTDGLQWIIFRTPHSGRGVEFERKRWSACGYVHSDKRALISCIKAKGLRLSATGRTALDRQDENIHRWRLDGSTGKMDLAA